MFSKILSCVTFQGLQNDVCGSCEYPGHSFRTITALAIVFLSAWFSGLVRAQSVTSYGFQVTVPIQAGTATLVPGFIAIDATGDIYLSDFSSNERLVEIPAGCDDTSCQTVIATGLGTPTGVALDGSGDIFVAEYGTGDVIEITPTCLSSGAPSSCWITISGSLGGLSLKNPTGIAIDGSGDLFIADFGNDRLVEVPEGCSSISCGATVGAGIVDPYGVALDHSGNVFVADFYGSKVVEVPVGCATLSCQTSISMSSGSSRPNGIAVDSSGNIFVGDFANNDIFKFSQGCLSSSCATTVGEGLTQPIGVAISSTEDIYIADYGNNRVVKAHENSFNVGTIPVGQTSAPVAAYFTFGASVSLNATTPYQVLTQGATGLDFADAGGGSCAATSYVAGNTCTVNVTLSPQSAGPVSGAVTLTDNSNNRIATGYVSGTGSGPEVTFLTNPVATTNLGSGLSSPAGLTIDRKGNIFVADSGNNAVDEFLAASSYSETTLGSGFSGPSDVAVDGAGNVFVADTGNSQVKELLAPAYLTINTVGSGFNGPSGVAIDGSGDIFVADTGNHAVKEIVAPGYTVVNTLNSSSFTSPSAIATDASGNLFVADLSLGSVSELTAASGFVTVVSPVTGLAQPDGLALDASGNVYVADSGHSAVAEFLAANSYAKSTLSTSITAPSGVALDAAGNVYVTAPGATKVGELELSAAPTLSFGTVSTGTTTAPKTVTVSNIGNADLTFPVAAAFDATTQSNLSFILDASTTCSTSPLTMGTNCADAIDFSPALAQAYSGSFTLTDNNDNTPSPYATQAINLSGTGETIAFVTASLSGGTVGVALTPQTLQVSGGSGNYTFALTGSALPAGLNLSSGGTISGTPTAGGTFTGIQVTATDTSTNATGNKTYSITIAPATITLATASLPDATYNSAYSQGLPAASGGTSPYTYSLLSGTMPPGLTVTASTGVISGIPTQGGSYPNFVIQVTDSSTGTGPYSTTQTYSLTVDLANQAPTLAVTGMPGTAQAYGATFTVGSSGGSGTGAVTFAASGACSNTSGGALITMSSGTGTCSVSATKAADSNYNSETSPVATVAATLANQAPTLAVTGMPGTAQAYGASFTVGSSGGSGTGAVTFAASGACSNTSGGALITMSSGTGTCSVSATKAADSNYNSETSPLATVAATLANQAPTLAVTGMPGTAQAYGATFTVGSSGGSGTGAVTFAASGACSNTSGGALITMSSGTGTCSVSATKAADSNYNSETSPLATVAATLANQAVLSVNVSSPATYNTQQTLTTTGGSGSGAVTYSVGASTACSVSGAVLSITSGTGTCSVTATKAADANYNSASSAAAPVTVVTATSVITTLPTASAITYGQMLSASTLTGGSATPSAGSFQWVTPTAVPLAGTQSESVIFVPTDTADYGSSAPGTINVTVNPASFVVTVSSDDSGTASNCTPQTTLGHGTDASCSLRDALLEAAAAGAGNIGFDSAVFGSASTITLANGALTLPSATTVAGPTTGSGASLANLVTVDGNNASTVFTIGSGVTGASIANLAIQHGNDAGIQNSGTLTVTGAGIISNTATGSGGGINNSGALTLSNSTISGNSASGSGGGIDNTGTLTLSNDTISGNSSSTSGGGINNAGTLVASDSTVSGNTAATASGGGGIDNVGSGTAALANDILSGNSSNSAADDFDGVAYADNGGNIVGVSNGVAVNANAIDLAPLGSYGGALQTLIPLPGSPAICAGLAAAIPSGLTTDERGLPNTNASYPSYPTCVDSGAVQTNYALSFTTQPASVSVATNFTAAVTLTESGVPFQPAVTIPLTLTGSGTLSGGSSTTSSGVATYTLQVDTAGTSDQLTANLVLNSVLVPTVAISATSNTFSVGSSTPTVVLSLSSATITYGTPETLTANVPVAATGSVTFYNNGSTVLGTGTVSAGVATFSSSTLAVGSYSITATYSGDSNYSSATSSPSTLTVTTADQATLTVTGMPVSPQVYGATFTVGTSGGSGTGAITFAASGACSVNSTSGLVTMTSGTGTCSVTATKAADTNYNSTTSVAATVNAALAGQATLTVTVSSPATYNTQQTLTTTGGAGTGAVTYSVGASTACSVSGATLSITSGAGTCSVTATKAADSNYSSVSSAAVSVTVQPATQTITFSASSPVMYGIGPIALSAQGGASGNPITFSLVSGPATLNGSTLSVTGIGTINITANQAGNTNYSAATPVSQSILVNPASLTVAANNASRVYGVANPAFSGSVSGAVNGDTFTESFVTAATITSNAGPYSIVPTAMGVDLADYSVTIQNGTLTITQAGTTTSLTSTSSSIATGQSVTLTAQVTSATTGTPTGSVNFYDGATLLGTVALTSGSAQFTTSALSGGVTHQLTASYGGDVNFTVSSSQSVSIVVATPDFSLSAGVPAGQTVSAGSTATYQLVVSPINGIYPGSVVFTVSGLPSGAVATFSPSSIPANGGQQTVSLSIKTAAASAANEPLNLFGHGRAAIGLALLLLPLIGARRFRRQRKNLIGMWSAFLLVLGVAAMGLSGCVSHPKSTAGTNYTLTITATSGNVQHSTDVNLNVN